MAIFEAFDSVAAGLGVAAAFGALALLVLLVSVRRDLTRLRRWQERDPEHPEIDVEASEVILDRAERELAELLGEDLGTPSTEIPIDPTTSERPALAQYTAEWEALHPEPRLKRVQRALARPRYAAAVVLVAVAAGVGAVALSLELLSGDGDGAPVAGETGISVAVLNATDAAGRAAETAQRVERRGFVLGTVGNADERLDQSVVMFAAGLEEEGRRVARALRIRPLQPLDAATRASTPDADVVVLVGRDAAGS